MRSGGADAGATGTRAPRSSPPCAREPEEMQACNTQMCTGVGGVTEKGALELNLREEREPSMGEEFGNCSDSSLGREHDDVSGKTSHKPHLLTAQPVNHVRRKAARSSGSFSWNKNEWEFDGSRGPTCAPVLRPHTWACRRSRIPRGPQGACEERTRGCGGRGDRKPAGMSPPDRQGGRDDGMDHMVLAPQGAHPL